MSRSDDFINTNMGHNLFALFYYNNIELGIQQHTKPKHKYFTTTFSPLSFEFLTFR